MSAYKTLFGSEVGVADLSVCRNVEHIVWN